MKSTQSGQKNSVVLDTNVIVSALLTKEGTPARILVGVGEKKLLNHISKDILSEIEEVLRRPKICERTTESERRAFLEMVEAISIKVNPKHRLDVIVEDPEDNKIIECALEAKAKYIITGDQHLLKLKEYKGIEVITAQEFHKKIGL